MKYILALSEYILNSEAEAFVAISVGGVHSVNQHSFGESSKQSLHASTLVQNSKYAISVGHPRSLTRFVSLDHIVDDT